MTDYNKFNNRIERKEGNSWQKCVAGNLGKPRRRRFQSSL